jgi:hypothetical protein
MTLAAMREAREAGYLTASLQASAAGQGIYARLGFVPCGLFRDFKPPAEPGLDRHGRLASPAQR